MSGEKILDLFAGCGGASCGFRDADYEIIGASEIWEPACNSYAENFPDTYLIRGDIRDTKEEIIEQFQSQNPIGIIGGPPCQGYSLAGYRNYGDERGDLFLEFVEIVEKLSPQFFVMENVPGILSMKYPRPNLSASAESSFLKMAEQIRRQKQLEAQSRHRELSSSESKEYEELSLNASEREQLIQQYLTSLPDLIQDLFRNLGYVTDARVLNAADYGVPQKRERVFFVGVLGAGNESVNLFPPTTHYKVDAQTRLTEYLDLPNLSPWVPVDEAIGDLETLPEDPAFSHLFTNHSTAMRDRLRNVPPGRSLYETYGDAWRRLLPDEPSWTVKQNHGGVFIHHHLDRVLTPRELARLQSFPDSFRFLGTKSQILTQIGNAIPPKLATAIGTQLRTVFSSD